MPTINDRLSDAAIRLGRYEGPGGFSVWRDDSPDGVVLIGIIWEESAEDGTKRESWDAYGSVHWPLGAWPLVMTCRQRVCKRSICWLGTAF